MADTKKEFDFKEFDKFAEESNWIFAKTYAKTFPHEYALQRESRVSFPDVARFIRQVGIPQKFFRATFYYLYRNGYKYWTMDKDVDMTTLVNREPYKNTK